MNSHYPAGFRTVLHHPANWPVVENLLDRTLPQLLVGTSFLTAIADAT